MESVILEISRIKEMMKLNEEEKSQYVIFVSGIETSMTHQGQVNIFKEGFGTKYLIKAYKYTQIDLVNDFIGKNSIAAVVLFSAGAGNANKIKGLSSSKIYCIEPWNDSSNSRGPRFESIPATNMYIDNQSYARGKGTKKGANFTNHDAGHFEALKTSAKSISNSL